MTNTPLSEREQELIRLVATGASNKEISQALHISVNTVKVHLRNIFTKLGVASRTEAAMWAVQNGLVETPTPESYNEEDVEKLGKSIERSSWLEFLPEKYRLVLYVGVALVFVVIGFGVSQLVLPARSTPQPGEILVSEDFEETRWKRLADMPTARAGLAAAVYDNQIYAIGGEGDQGVLGANERYDPESDSWEVLAPKPIPVADVHAGVVGGQIYVPGGRLSDGQITEVLEIYDPRTGVWSQGTPVPTQLSAYALATFEGKIYLFGGWDGSQYLDSVFIYDPALDDWSEGTPMPTARGFAGAAELEGKIFLIGGYNDEAVFDEVFIYDPNLTADLNVSWGSGDPFPDQCRDIAVSSIANIIYAFGQKCKTELLLDKISFLHHPGTWEAIDTPPKTINVGSRLVSLNSDLYDLGGIIGSIFLGDLHRYKAVYTVIVPIVR